MPANLLFRITSFIYLIGAILAVQGCASREARNDSARPPAATQPPTSATNIPLAPDGGPTANEKAIDTAGASPSKPPREDWTTKDNLTPTPDGKVVFDWPSQMKINETYLIHLAIACNVPLQYLQEQVDSLVVVDADTAGQHRRRRSKANVKLGRHMKATLMGASIGDSSVTIARPPDDTGNRTLDLQTDTSVVWSWNVTPHRAGPMKLTMYLIRVDENDSRPVDVQTILVQGIPPSVYDQITNVLTKLNALWLLLSTGVAGALVKYLRDRRSKSQPTSTAPPGRGP